MILRYTFIILIFSVTIVQAKEIIPAAAVPPALVNGQKTLELSSKNEVCYFFRSADKKKFNRLNALHQPLTEPQLDEDDTVYNKRAPVWKPAAQVIAVNALFMGFNRYVAKADYSYVNSETWEKNLKSEPEWDSDHFGINFIGHPYQGTLYFNAARSQGYSYWQSLPFAIAGSLTWEYFGENTLPSYNDMIYTPLNGAALGEIFYRISSSILDDRTRGRERAMREIAAGLINPVRGFNRLLQGKTFQVTDKDVYEKEPLNLTVFAGIHRLNEQQNEVFGKGGNNAMLSLQLDYGKPFEVARRKPFDFFRLRTEFSTGADTVGGMINNVTGYGILLGRNMQIGKLALLTGAFQYYDFWNTRNFELGALGFGGGVFSKIEFRKSINLYTNVHLGVVPLAGNSTRFGPDTNGFRDYTFTNGVQSKVESTLTLGKHVSTSFVYYHFWLHTFEGLKGSNSIGIVRPRVTVRLLKNISLGYEHFGYTTNRWLKDYPNQRSVITEQKLFLQLFLEAPQRSGRYN
ncbi:DUF3943 domain-containing protein [Pontibacter sp. KCTC 32443]|uniref:DUF3943 domain-containing protein n=1 Tax=Pontibacter TaxID=323449 RepID=UPI00164E91AA|nr:MULTISPECIES: DUF3943 domain-containing protein [Pontibacter]MBC5774690.1 DUF3943 domain-containing protein [Pontibacter sp. KCTC 32443]